MATVVPRTWAANEVVTAANLNTELNANMARTESALADTAGYFISNSASESELVLSRPIQRYSGGSVSYERGDGDPFWLTGLGPKITVPTYTRFLIMFSVRSDSALDNSGVYCGVTIDGETPSILDAIQYRNQPVMRGSAWRLLIDAPSGSPSTRTIELSYGVAATSGNTGFWAQRLLTVLPIG